MSSLCGRRGKGGVRVNARKRQGKGAYHSMFIEQRGMGLLGGGMLCPGMSCMCAEWSWWFILTSLVECSMLTNECCRRGSPQQDGGLSRVLQGERSPCEGGPWKQFGNGRLRSLRCVHARTRTRK